MSHKLPSAFAILLFPLLAAAAMADNQAEQSKDAAKITDPWQIVTAYVDQTPAAPPRQEALEALVTRLGAARYPDREAASKEFAKIGLPAQSALEKHADDTDPEVAFRVRALLRDLRKKQTSSKRSPEELPTALNTLIAQKDPRTFQPLVTLLSHPSDIIRHYAEYALRRLTGDDRGFIATAPEETRAAAVVRWRQWLLDTKDPPLPPHELQVLIVADPDGRKVVLLPVAMFVKTGKEGPDAPPDDLDFAAEMHKVINLKEKVFCATPLPNGNLLVGLDGSPGRVAEINRRGEEVWSSAKATIGHGRVNDAKRLANGNTLICYPDGGEIFEITPDAGIAWNATGLGAPTSATRLDNGNTLVSEQSANRIAEIAPDGGVAWKRECQKPVEAVKLPNGNILTLSMTDKKVYEIDARGMIVWSAEAMGTGLCMLRDGTTALTGGHTPPRIIGRAGTQLSSAEGRSTPSHFGTVRAAPPGWIVKNMSVDTPKAETEEGQ